MDCGLWVVTRHVVLQTITSVSERITSIHGRTDTPNQKSYKYKHLL
jgi:hypothetical protein